MWNGILDSTTGVNSMALNPVNGDNRNGNNPMSIVSRSSYTGARGNIGGMVGPIGIAVGGELGIMVTETVVTQEVRGIDMNRDKNKQSVVSKKTL